MPITKSAQKARRQSEKRRIQNSRKKREIKNLIKEVKNLISQKKGAEAKNFLPKVYRALDKAVKTGLIKKNTSSRRKSRIAKLILKSR